MRFLLDESADHQLAAHLEQSGHDVKAIAHDYPNALKDSEVLAIALGERRILVTNDHDFGELIFRRKLPHAGVILFRLRNESLPNKISLLDLLLENYAAELTEYVVVSEGGVRVRRAAAR